MTQQFTTDYDQSLRLLNAGLERETADYYFKDTPSGRKSLEWRGEDIVFPLTASEVPSWSLARLWDLLHRARIFFYQYDTGDSPEHVIESLTYALERAARKGRLSSGLLERGRGVEISSPSSCQDHSPGHEGALSKLGESGGWGICARVRGHLDP